MHSICIIICNVIYIYIHTYIHTFIYIYIYYIIWLSSQVSVEAARAALDPAEWELLVAEERVRTGHYYITLHYIILYYIISC